MRKVIIFIFGCVLLCACDEPQVREGRSLYKKYFQKVLNDPESFKVYSEKYKIVDNMQVDWTLDMGAKNAYGAMIRKEEKFSTFGKYYFNIGGRSYSSKELE